VGTAPTPTLCLRARASSRVNEENSISGDEGRYTERRETDGCAHLLLLFLVGKPGLQLTRPRRPWESAAPSVLHGTQRSNAPQRREKGGRLRAGKHADTNAFPWRDRIFPSPFPLTDIDPRSRRAPSARREERWGSSAALRRLPPHSAFSSASTTANPIPEGRRGSVTPSQLREDTTVQAWFAHRPTPEQETAAPRVPRAPFVPWNY